MNLLKNYYNKQKKKMNNKISNHNLIKNYKHNIIK